MPKNKLYFFSQYISVLIFALVVSLVPTSVWAVSTIGENIVTDGGVTATGAVYGSNINTHIYNPGGYNMRVGNSMWNIDTNSGLYNVSISGIGALQENTTGSYNIGVGLYAGRKNTTGDSNVAIGYQTLHYNDGGSNNVAVGEYALWGASGQSYSGNVAVGVHAGRFNRGTNNSYFGGYSGYSVTTGENNVLLGHRAGYSLTTGSNNIIIGYNINPTSTSMTRGLNIGNLLFGTGLDGTGTTISSGNIGIASTTPYAKLSINNSAGQKALVIQGSDGSALDRMMVDDEGNIIIGDQDTALGHIHIKSENGGTGMYIAYTPRDITYPPGENFQVGSWDGTTFVERMRILDTNGSGAIGFGDTSPDFGIESLATSTSGYFGITDSTDGDIFAIDLDGEVGIGLATPSYPIHLASGAHVTGAGVWTDASDRTLKYDIVDSPYGLAEVLQLSPKKYRYNVDDSLDIGFIAQDIQKVMPELVSSSDGTELLGLKYSHMTAVLTKAIQELYYQFQNGSGNITNLIQGNAGGTIMADALVVSDSIVTNTLTVRGALTLSADTAGQVVIPAGETQIDVVFSEPYDTVPVMSLTILGRAGLDTNLRVAPVYVGTDGFTIEINEVRDTDIVIDWLAVLTGGKTQATREKHEILHMPEVVEEEIVQEKSADEEELLDEGEEETINTDVYGEQLSQKITETDSTELVDENTQDDEAVVVDEEAEVETEEVEL